MLTVRHALKLGGLASSNLVAGHQGLDNEICSVDVIEVPDIRGWISPNEFAVTCGYAIRENSQAQIGLVRAMAESKAAALAVKPGRFLGGSMPRVMIEVAEEEGLPLIEVPVDIPYTQITLPVLSAILNEQVSRLQYASHVHEVLIRSVIENQGIDSIAEIVSQVIGSPVYIVDQGGHVLTCSGGNSDHVRIERFLRDEFYRWRLNGTNKDTGSPGTGLYLGDFLCIPAVGKGGVLGYLIVDRWKQSKLSIFEETALQESITVIVLELTKRKIVREAETTAKRRLLLDHGFPRIVSDAAVDRKTLLGLGLETPYVVLVVKIREGICGSRTGQSELWSNERLDSMLDLVKAPERLEWLPVSLDRGKGELTILCSGVEFAGGGRLSEFAVEELRRFRTEISLSIGSEVLFGASRVHKGAQHFEIAEGEALKALGFRHLAGNSDGTLLFQDMSAYEFISNVDKNVQVEFAKDNLSPLLNTDSNPELIKTLRVFLQCGGQVTQAANKLFMHRNTLNYRLDKISMLLGCDVRDTKNQFTLSLALLAGMFSGVVKE